MSVSEIRQFIQGITKLERVPASASAKLAKADGYLVDDGVARPVGGQTKVSSNAIAVNSGYRQSPHPLVCAPTPSGVRLVTVDANQNVRFLTVGSEQTPWSTGGSVAPAPGSDAAVIDGHVVFATVQGLKAAPTDGSMAVSDLTPAAPESAPVLQFGNLGVAVEVFGQNWQNNWFFDEGITYNLRGPNAGWGRYDGIPVLSIMISTVPTNGGFGKVWSTPASWSGFYALGFWLYSYEDIPAGGLVVRIWSGNRTGSLVSYALPSITAGWRQVWLPLQNYAGEWGAGPSTVGSVEFAVHSTQSAPVTYFHLSEIYLYESQDPKTEWHDDVIFDSVTYSGAEIRQAVVRPFGLRYRYAESQPWSGESLGLHRTVSNPSPEAKPMFTRQSKQIEAWLGFGDYIVVTVPERTSPIDKTAVYRQVVSEAQAGNFVLAKVLTGTTVQFDDYGTSASEADADDIPLIMEVDHEPVTSCATVCRWGQRLVAGCLEYQQGAWKRPTMLAISNAGEPWYFPTSYDETSPPHTGTRLDNYTTLSSRVVALLPYGDGVLVFCDREVFLLQGTSVITGLSIVKLATVSIVAPRSVAVVGDRAYFLADEDVYEIAGTSVDRVATFAIDVALIDRTQPIDGAAWQDKYVLSCVYDGTPTLLIYNPRTQAWVNHTVTQVLSQATASDGRLFAVNYGGFAEQVFCGKKNLDANGNEQDRTYELRTAPLLVTEVGTECGISGVYLQCEGKPNTSVTITVSGYGVSGTHTCQRTIQLDGRTSYSAGVDVLGDAVAVGLTYTGDDPPEILAFGLGVGGIERGLGI